jgi:hypothetical protein
MEKWMSLGALGVSGLLLVLFLLDAILGFPFGGLSFFVDVLAVLSAGIVGFLAWESFQEFK